MRNSILLTFKPTDLDNPFPNAFPHPLTIVPEDIDVMGHVNNVVYVRWVQEVAIAHWLQAAPDLRAKYSWVLLRHEIDYKNPAFLNDQVMGYTWVGNYEGPKVDRYVTLTNVRNGKILAESKTTWCLLDAVLLKPRRVEGDIMTAFGVGINGGR